MTTININVHEGGEVSKSAPKTEPWNGDGIAGQVVKATDEQRYTLTVAYPANTPDIGVARDGFQDFASASEVEKAAWGYMQTGRSVGLWHQDGTEGAGEVVESYITRSDQVFKAADGSEQVVPEGSWLVGIVWNEPTWNLVKKGEIGGTSMQGKVRRRTPNPSDIAKLKRRA